MGIEGVGRFLAGVEHLAQPGREAAEPRPAPQRAADVRAVLTPDELTYFAELERLGTLTYGRRGVARAEAAGPVLGQRVDARA